MKNRVKRPQMISAKGCASRGAMLESPPFCSNHQLAFRYIQNSSFTDL
ncbi:hypothetical protein ABN702_09865 [Bacillus haimaensis]